MKTIIPLDNPDLFLNAKKYLEDNNIIQTEQTISKFIESLSLDKTVYIKDDIVIPFRLIDKYLFYTPISKDKDDEFLNKLKTLNYEFTKLNKISFDDVVLNKLDSYKYFFIINGEYWVNPDAK